MRKQLAPRNVVNAEVMTSVVDLLGIGVTGVGVTKETISQVCQKMADLPESDKPSASHLTDFNPPVYNVWKFQEKTSGISNHYGNTEVTIVDNLLYL